MAHDIFISYALEDKPTADAVCAALETSDTRCWIAPRDVLPGVGYAEALVDAISESRLMVLVFSSRSNSSPQVMREVERAASKGIPILPFRIEDVPLSKPMEFFLSAPHWLDALTPPLEKHLEHLPKMVKALLAMIEAGEELKYAHRIVAHYGTSEDRARLGALEREVRAAIESPDADSLHHRVIEIAHLAETVLEQSSLMAEADVQLRHARRAAQDHWRQAIEDATDAFLMQNEANLDALSGRLETDAQGGKVIGEPFNVLQFRMHQVQQLPALLDVARSNADSGLIPELTLVIRTNEGVLMRDLREALERTVKDQVDDPNRGPRFAVDFLDSLRQTFAEWEEESARREEQVWSLEETAGNNVGIAIADLRRYVQSSLRIQAFGHGKHRSLLSSCVEALNEYTSSHLEVAKWAALRRILVTLQAEAIGAGETVMGTKQSASAGTGPTVTAEYAPTHQTLNAPRPSDHLHFTVTAPHVVQPQDRFVINVWAHLARQRESVIRQAREAAVGEIVAQPKGPFEVARGALLSVELKVEGMIVEELGDTVLWSGEIANATFAARVPDRGREGRRVGVATVRTLGLRIAQIPFVITVGRRVSDLSAILHEGEPFRKAFASYARADRNEVLGRIQGMQKAAPQLDVFLDVLSLRSGQNWEQELWEAIPARDIFYLFWSASASESEWVQKEWRCALETKGLNFIDPVPLVSPEVVPPPPELASKHFDDWVLAFKGGATRQSGSQDLGSS